jgi:hypothetical protein
MVLKLLFIMLFPTLCFSQRRLTDNSNLTRGEVNTLIGGGCSLLNGTGFVKVSGTTISYDNTTYQTQLSGTGFAKLSGTTVTYDNSAYLTITDAALTYQPIGSYLISNQTITLSGDITGSGTTAITTTIGSGKVTNAMLAGSIAASKLVGSDITLNESQITNLTTDLAAKQSISTNEGGWTVTKVSGSDFTTTNTSLTDVTGLVTGTLSTATLYEFEAVLYVNSSSTAGITIGVQQSGTGSGQIGVFTGTATSAAATGMAIGSNALNTASAACVLVAGDGQITIKGFIKTGSAGSPTISIKVAKATSGTAKVYIGSKLRYRAA